MHSSSPSRPDNNAEPGCKRTPNVALRLLPLLASSRRRPAAATLVRRPPSLCFSSRRVLCLTLERRTERSRTSLHTHPRPPAKTRRGRYQSKPVGRTAAARHGTLPLLPHPPPVRQSRRLCLPHPPQDPSERDLNTHPGVRILTKLLVWSASGDRAAWR